eukprot:764067-Hanusia_phi.AAC.1
MGREEQVLVLSQEVGPRGRGDGTILGVGRSKYLSSHKKSDPGPGEGVMVPYYYDGPGTESGAGGGGMEEEEPIANPIWLSLLGEAITLVLWVAGWQVVEEALQSLPLLGYAAVFLLVMGLKAVLLRYARERAGHPALSGSGNLAKTQRVYRDPRPPLQLWHVPVR